MILAKMMVFMILMLPAMILTAVIWIFGGWTRKYDMPNPAFALVRWVDS